MSDPYSTSNGGSSHQPWNYPGYDSAQNQGRYPGYYQGSYPPPGGYQYPGWNIQQRTHGITIAALVLGVISAVLSLVPFFGFIAFLLGPLAVIFGIVGIVKRYNRRGFAVAGLVTGAFGVLVSILYALLFSTMMQYMDKTETYEFVTRSVGEYQLSITTTDPIPEIANNQRGTYRERMPASSFYGGVVVTNVGDNEGNLGCKIFNSDGELVAEDAATGLGAQAVCMIGAPWMGNDYEFDINDVLDARAINPTGIS